MKRNCYTVFLFLSIFSLVVSSCNKGKGDQLILIVDPEGSQKATNGQILTFNINVVSESAINNIAVREKRHNALMKVIADTVPGRKTFRWQFEYRVPSLDTEQELLDLYFEATDNDGNWKQLPRIISVFTDGKDVLNETSGHTMYSSASTDFNAFNLTENKLFYVPLYDTLFTMDSLSVHIADGTKENSLGLSRRWISPAGCKFVRFNDFDYGNATKTAVKSAYESGLKRDFIDNISEDDLIITRFKQNDSAEFQYAAIKIIEVIDVDGTTDKDRYIFNIKK